MTTLRDYIDKNISTDGFISLHDYMDLRSIIRHWVIIAVIRLLARMVILSPPRKYHRCSGN
jgi:hypothetical protein